MVTTQQLKRFIYFCRRSTTLRTSALKISCARLTKGFASAASCTLPASTTGAATTAAAFPSPPEHHETRRRAQPLQFLADDLFRCCIHRQAEHFLAHARHRDTHARAIQRPRAAAQQLRG